DPIGLIFGIVDKTARERLHSVSAALGDRYLEEGSELIDQALDAQTLEEFGTTLYRAGPLLFAARQIFNGLIEGKRETVQASAVAVYAKRANVAEERAVRVNT